LLEIFVSESRIGAGATLMVKQWMKKLPVVENDKPIGVVSSMDLIRAVPQLADLRRDLMKIRRKTPLKRVSSPKKGLATGLSMCLLQTTSSKVLYNDWERIKKERNRL